MIDQKPWPGARSCQWIGASVRSIPATPDDEMMRALDRAMRHSVPKPTALIVNFPSNPTAYLADVATAGGIALIGTGNVGGFLAPNLKVWADEHFHSSSAGLYVLAALTVVNAALIAILIALCRPMVRKDLMRVFC